MAAKPTSPPPSTAIVLQLILSVIGGVNVHVQLMVAWGPLIESEKTRNVNVHSSPTSMTMVPDELVPATEVVDLNVRLPLVTDLPEDPKRLSVHVVLPSPLKVRLPDRDLPSALVLPVKSDLGHLNLRPLLSIVKLEFVDVAVKLELTGVKLALAGGDARATAASTAAATRAVRAKLVIDHAFLGAGPPRG